MNSTDHLAVSSTKPNWRLIGVGGLVILYIAFICLFRLHLWPAPWYDEGAYLSVAKNYAATGVYADHSSEGDRYTGAVVSVGPTVILPIAVAYKLFGVSFTLGRLVIVVYALLTLLVIYALCVVLLDWRLGLAAVLLLVAAPQLNLQFYARSVWGEVPGMFFTFAALYVWFRPGKRGIPGLLAVGVLFGLAGITKNQEAFFILPSILAAFILNILVYRRQNWLNFIIPGVIAGLMYLGWTYYVLFLLGAGARNSATDFAQLRALGNSVFFVFNSATNNTTFSTLVENNGVYNGLFIVAILYGLTLIFKRDGQSDRWRILYVFFVISAVLYIFSSGLDRYGIPALMLGGLFVAHLLYRLSNGFHLDWQGLRGIVRGQDLSMSALLSLLVVGFAFGLVLLPAYKQAKATLTQGNDDPYRVVAYLNQHVPPSAVIETFESELNILTQFTIHRPPYGTLVNLMSGRAKRGSMDARYNFHDWGNPDIIVIGHFAKIWDAGVYFPDQLTDYTLEKSIGEYDIYQRNATAGQ